MFSNTACLFVFSNAEKRNKYNKGDNAFATFAFERLHEMAAFQADI